MVYIVRGLPGSGKSTFAKTLAKSLNIPFWEADQFFYKDGQYNFDPTKLGEAHAQCFENFCKTAFDGCVVSNTFTTEKELEKYCQFCVDNCLQFTVLIVENRHGNKSIHDVPETVVDTMRNRFSVKL